MFRGDSNCTAHDVVSWHFLTFPLRPPPTGGAQDTELMMHLPETESVPCSFTMPITWLNHSLCFPHYVSKTVNYFCACFPSIFHQKSFVSCSLVSYRLSLQSEFQEKLDSPRVRTNRGNHPKCTCSRQSAPGIGGISYPKWDIHGVQTLWRQAVVWSY